MKELSLVQARRIALGAQGFCDPRPTGRVDARHFRRVLDRMTILQLDSVNVLCRSHFMPVFARLGPYDRDRLDAWIWRSGQNHESVAHEASITSMDLYPLLRHRIGIGGWKSGTQFREENTEYLDAIRAEITERGPLSVRDLSAPGERIGSWWGWSKGKVALQVMYRSGDLAIAERTKTFLTRYDLPERVVPELLRTGPAVDPTDAQRSMLLLAARSHGIGTDKDLADYFRLRITECRPLLDQLVADELLDVVRVEGWDEIAYMARGANCPRAVKARTLLSPFDPVIWFRPRAERLFGFHYRIEIYVPEAKRVHGYYVLPFLLDDRLVGRVDLKADRKSGTLQAKGAFLEPEQDLDVVAPAMAQTLREMADWLGLDRVSVGSRGDLAGPLAEASR